MKDQSRHMHRDDIDDLTHKVKIDVHVFDRLELDVLDESFLLLEEASLRSIKLKSPLLRLLKIF